MYIVIQGCLQDSKGDLIKAGLRRPELYRDHTGISNELAMQMVSLTIDLQDGFANDTVVVDVAGKEVFHEKNINTNYAIGLAESLKIKLPKGRLHVTISLLERDISNSFVGEISEPVYLGVSVSSDRTLEFILSREAFKYL